MTARTRDRVAGAWGFAEAVLFFVIPDVFLTYVAVRFGAARAWRPALWATAGAVAGGFAMYSWAATSPDAAFAALELVPAVDGVMIDGVRAEVAAHGNPALFGGPLQGRPYKLFAAASGGLELSAVTLAILTVPARLGRFVVAVALAGWARRVFSRWFSVRVLASGWGAFWMAVYAAYWLT